MHVRCSARPSVFCYGPQNEEIMRNVNCWLAVVTIALAANSLVQAQDIKVIANASVTATAVSAEELKGVFLLTKSSLKEGGHVQPVLEKGGAAHDVFLKQYVGKSDAALETYYRTLVFTGKGSMPKTVASDAEVAAWVAKTK